MRMLIALPLSLVLSVAAAAERGVPAPYGIWMRGDGNARVRIAPCGAKLCATNLWIRDPSGGEAVGDRLVMSLAPKGGSTLAGSAFDPKRNLTYALEMQVGAKRLETRGCILGQILCKTVSWSRTK